MTEDPPSFGVDLPEDFRALLTTDAERVAALYNGFQGMDAAAFEGAFGESLARLRRVAAVDAPELAAVLGLALDAGTVVDATLLSVRARDDGRVLHAADGTDAPDEVVYLPVRPDDFPPGSDEPVDDLALDDFREVVASMLYVRYQLCEDDPDRYDDLYRQPLARGLAAYAEE